MRPHALLLTSAVALALAVLPGTALAQAKPAKPTAAAPPALREAVDPSSVDALERMGSYLRTLQTFQLKADILTDEVMDDGRKLQFASTATYKVRRPNGFVIELASDRKVRTLYYDGKTATLSAPRVGFYAQVPAPPTIQKTLDVLHERGVEVPLEDLFRWGEPGDSRGKLVSGFYVGPARVGGVETDQYAFSTEDLDWQLWIDRGERPLPRKIVITSVFDDAAPQFTAQLNWSTPPNLTDADFTFTPPPNSKSITFAATGAAAQ